MLRRHACLGLDPLAESRGAAIALVAPILAGVSSPWAVWITAGSVGATALAVSSVLMAGLYLHVVWWLGDREAELRRHFGRRYRPPPPDLALAVCMGLAASMLAPGLSALALVDRVGLPRAAGLVESYDPAALGAAGAAIDLSPAIPSRTVLEVIPGGVARVFVPRFGNPTPFALSWNATPAEFCIAPRRCLSVDRSSGRVSIHNEVVGRITSVGNVSSPNASDLLGPPWEILNLFR